MNKLINPFERMPLRQTACWGGVALILTAIMFWHSGLRLTSLTQVNFAGDELWAAALRQAAAWLLFSAVLYAAGALLAAGKVRFRDVAASNLFARIPFDLSMAIFMVPRMRSVMGLLAEGNINTAFKYMGSIGIISAVSLVTFVWYIVWTYKAFAVSTGMRNGKGAATFAVCFIVSYIASIYLLRLF